MPGFLGSVAGEIEIEPTSPGLWALLWALAWTPPPPKEQPPVPVSGLAKQKLMQTSPRPPSNQKPQDSAAAAAAAAAAAVRYLVAPPWPPCIYTFIYLPYSSYFTGHCHAPPRILCHFAPASMMSRP
ncbi:hypothetical protein VDGL01_01259 [Verticillium dahliae]